MGDLLSLLTVNKDTIVDAINEIDSNVKALSPTDANTEGQVLTVQTDGTVAYQDLPKVDLSVKLNKPEIDGTEGQILTLNADLKPEWVTSSAVPEYTVDDAQKVLTVNASGDGLIWGAGGGDGALADWKTSTAIGNLEAGFDLNGKSPLEILRLITVAYVNPSAKITFFGGDATNKKGTSFDLTVALEEVKGGDNPVSKMILYKKGAVIEELSYVEGTTKYTFATININDTTTIEVKVYDTNKKVVGSSKTYTFVDPTYTGVLDDIPTEESILGFEEMLRTKGNYTGTYTANNQYVVYATPKSFSTLNSILDGNNFENLSSFERIELTIGTVNYYVYYTKVKQTLTNFKYVFKY